MQRNTAHLRFRNDSPKALDAICFYFLAFLFEVIVVRVTEKQ